ncbi:unnamed protein product [Amoebophrya sp. A25]|nr:unnamed protein product [Amoebophrya sp. A25]|eukprot:GSA25T00003163001.1
MSRRQPTSSWLLAAEGLPAHIPLRNSITTLKRATESEIPRRWLLSEAEAERYRYYEYFDRWVEESGPTGAQIRYRWTEEQRRRVLQICYCYADVDFVKAPDHLNSPGALRELQETLQQCDDLGQILKICVANQTNIDGSILVHKACILRILRMLEAWGAASADFDVGHSETPLHESFWKNYNFVHELAAVDVSVHNRPSNARVPSPVHPPPPAPIAAAASASSASRCSSSHQKSGASAKKAAAKSKGKDGKAPSLRRAKATPAAASATKKSATTTTVVVETSDSEAEEITDEVESSSSDEESESSSSSSTSDSEVAARRRREKAAGDTYTKGELKRKEGVDARAVNEALGLDEEEDQDRTAATASSKSSTLNASTAAADACVPSGVVAPLVPSSSHTATGGCDSPVAVPALVPSSSANMVVRLDGRETIGGSSSSSKLPDRLLLDEPGGSCEEDKPLTTNSTKEGSNKMSMLVLEQEVGDPQCGTPATRPPSDRSNVDEGDSSLLEEVEHQVPSSSATSEVGSCVDRRDHLDEKGPGGAAAASSLYTSVVSRSRREGDERDKNNDKSCRETRPPDNAVSRPQAAPPPDAEVEDFPSLPEEEGDEKQEKADGDMKLAAPPHSNKADDYDAKDGSKMEDLAVDVPVRSTAPPAVDPCKVEHFPPVPIEGSLPPPSAVRPPSAEEVALQRHRDLCEEYVDDCLDSGGGYNIRHPLRVYFEVLHRGFGLRAEQLRDIVNVINEESGHSALWHCVWWILDHHREHVTAGVGLTRNVQFLNCFGFAALDFPSLKVECRFRLQPAQLDAMVRRNLQYYERWLQKHEPAFFVRYLSARPKRLRAYRIAVEKVSPIPPIEQAVVSSTSTNNFPAQAEARGVLEDRGSRDESRVRRGAVAAPESKNAQDKAASSGASLAQYSSEEGACAPKRRKLNDGTGAPARAPAIDANNVDALKDQAYLEMLRKRAAALGKPLVSAEPWKRVEGHSLHVLKTVNYENNGRSILHEMCAEKLTLSTVSVSTVRTICEDHHWFEHLNSWDMNESSSSTWNSSSSSSSWNSTCAITRSRTSPLDEILRLPATEARIALARYFVEDLEGRFCLYHPADHPILNLAASNGYPQSLVQKIRKRGSSLENLFPLEPSLQLSFHSEAVASILTGLGQNFPQQFSHVQLGRAAASSTLRRGANTGVSPRSLEMNSFSGYSGAVHPSAKNFTSSGVPPSSMFLPASRSVAPQPGVEGGGSVKGFLIDAPRSEVGGGSSVKGFLIDASRSQRDALAVAREAGGGVTVPSSSSNAQIPDKRKSAEKLQALLPPGVTKWTSTRNETLLLDSKNSTYRSIDSTRCKNNQEDEQLQKIWLRVRAPQGETALVPVLTTTATTGGSSIVVPSTLSTAVMCDSSTWERILAQHAEDESGTLGEGASTLRRRRDSTTTTSRQERRNIQNNPARPSSTSNAGGKKRPSTSVASPGNLQAKKRNSKVSANSSASVSGGAAPAVNITGGPLNLKLPGLRVGVQDVARKMSAKEQFAGFEQPAHGGDVNKTASSLSSTKAKGNLGTSTNAVDRPGPTKSPSSSRKKASEDPGDNNVRSGEGSTTGSTLEGMNPNKMNKDSINSTHDEESPIVIKRKRGRPPIHAKAKEAAKRAEDEERQRIREERLKNRNHNKHQSATVDDKDDAEVHQEASTYRIPIPEAQKQTELPDEYHVNIVNGLHSQAFETSGLHSQALETRGSIVNSCPTSTITKGKTKTLSIQSTMKRQRKGKMKRPAEDHQVGVEDQVDQGLRVTTASARDRHEADEQLRHDGTTERTSCQQQDDSTAVADGLSGHQSRRRHDVSAEHQASSSLDGGYSQLFEDDGVQDRNTEDNIFIHRRTTPHVSSVTTTSCTAAASSSSSTSTVSSTFKRGVNEAGKNSTSSHSNAPASVAASKKTNSSTNHHAASLTLVGAKTTSNSIHKSSSVVKKISSRLGLDESVVAQQSRSAASMKAFHPVVSEPPEEEDSDHDEQHSHDEKHGPLPVSSRRKQQASVEFPNRRGVVVSTARTGPRSPPRTTAPRTPLGSETSSSSDDEESSPKPKIYRTRARARAEAMAQQREDDDSSGESTRYILLKELLKPD